MVNDEEQIREFFANNKLDVADNGFSNKVMRQLSDKKDYTWIVGIFAAFGIAISLFLILKLGLISQVYNHFINIHMLYVVLFMFCFPIVTVLIYCLQVKCRFDVFKMDF